MKIIFEDKYLMVCEKPIGVQSQESADGENMLSLLSQYRRDHGEDEYVGLVHRLDTATGGVMIYSKSRSLTGKLCELVGGEDYRKEYLAAVEGIPEAESGELCDLLYHDKQKNKSYVVKKERRGVKEARATYKLVETVKTDDGREISLVSVTLITGRTHQIRVQFASRGMSLVGDGKYGSRDNKTSCALWSHKVSFLHPVTGKSVTAQSFPPSVYPWNLFAALGK